MDWHKATLKHRVNKCQLASVCLCERENVSFYVCKCVCMGGWPYVCVSAWRAIRICVEDSRQKVRKHHATNQCLQSVITLTCALTRHQVPYSGTPNSAHACMRARIKHKLTGSKHIDSITCTCDLRCAVCALTYPLPPLLPSVHVLTVHW